MIDIFRNALTCAFSVEVKEKRGNAELKEVIGPAEQHNFGGKQHNFYIWQKIQIAFLSM